MLQQSSCSRLYFKSLRLNEFAPNCEPLGGSTTEQFQKTSTEQEVSRVDLYYDDSLRLVVESARTDSTAFLAVSLTSYYARSSRCGGATCPTAAAEAPRRDADFFEPFASVRRSATGVVVVEMMTLMRTLDESADRFSAHVRTSAV
jgi:hypothetical protein